LNVKINGAQNFKQISNFKVLAVKIYQFFFIYELIPKLETHLLDLAFGIINQAHHHENDSENLQQLRISGFWD